MMNIFFRCCCWKYFPPNEWKLNSVERGLSFSYILVTSMSPFRWIYLHDSFILWNLVIIDLMLFDFELIPPPPNQINLTHSYSYFKYNLCSYPLNEFALSSLTRSWPLPPQQYQITWVDGHYKDQTLQPTNGYRNDYWIVYIVFI